MKKKNKIIPAVFFLCAILMLLSVVFILYNGSQQIEQSLSRSNAVAERVQTVVHTDTTGSGNTNIGGLVRKSAHAIEYALLGLFAALTALLGKNMCGRLHIACPIALVLAVAITDEYIQSFGSRSSQVKDIVIDACGGMAGMLVAVGVYFAAKLLIKRIRKHKNAAHREDN